MLDERGERDGSGWRGREPAPGTQVAGFTLQECLATGSSGSVYRAERGGRRFAIKLVPMGRWGEREVDALRRVRHTSVVGLLGYGQWPEDKPSFLVLALEWVDGPALDEWARDNRCTAWEWVEQVLLPVVGALGQVHAAGVVHRDVKEANIVMRREDGRPVLVDFGSARYEGAPRLTMRLPPGTPEYRSPEIWRFAREWEGEPYESRPADDLWALGVTLYSLLTRTLPFGDRHGPLVRTILEHTPEAPHVRNPRVPRALGEVCLRMLEKAPEARYADTQELARALEAALAQADDTWRVPLFDEEEGPERTGPEPSPRQPAPAAARTGWLRPLGLSLLTALLLLPGPRLLPSEMGSASPRPGLPAPLPSQEAGLCQELADAAKTAEVGFRAELLESPAPAPANATHREDKPMRKPHPGRSLLKSTLVSAACVSAACVSTPPPRPRPPAECPPGHDETLKRFGFERRGWHSVVLIPVDDAIKSRTKTITVQEGPFTTAEILTPWEGIPDQTRLYGQLFFEDNRVHGYFTQLILRTGETLPVCLRLTQGLTAGMPMKPGSRAGKAIISIFPAVETVDRFYY
jgi:serine/threonine protein kinase